MVRLRNALMIVALATGAIRLCPRAARPDTTTPTGRSSTAPQCDDFPTPAYGPNYSMMPGSYSGPAAGESARPRGGHPHVIECPAVQRGGRRDPGRRADGTQPTDGARPPTAPRRPRLPPPPIPDHHKDLHDVEDRSRSRPGAARSRWSWDLGLRQSALAPPGRRSIHTWTGTYAEFPESVYNTPHVHGQPDPDDG